jgi:hypothetical protein
MAQPVSQPAVYANVLKTQKKNWQCALLYPMLKGFRKNLAFCKVFRFLPLVLLIRATCGWTWVWSIDGMILKDGNWRARGKTYPTATLSTTDLTWADLGSNSCLGIWKQTINHVSHDTVKTKLNANCI